jgi:hypothetical protein
MWFCRTKVTYTCDGTTNILIFFVYVLTCFILFINKKKKKEILYNKKRPIGSYFVKLFFVVILPSLINKLIF